VLLRLTCDLFGLFIIIAVALVSAIAEPVVWNISIEMSIFVLCVVKL